MSAQTFIISELNRLKDQSDVMPAHPDIPIVQQLCKLLTSKKFRKYGLSDEYREHIQASIAASVSANEPIKLVFFGGCYKLWRLDEFPEADWAELFAYMYYTRWVKEICALYKPGVWFDFLLDDYIVPRLNNITEQDVAAYRKSRDDILAFIKPYQPINLHMTHTNEGSLFTDRQAYETALQMAIVKLEQSLPNGLPELTESSKASVELNTRATPEQMADPLWREKVELVHSAYYVSRNETGYYAPETHKIICFTQPFAPGKPLAVGTTKDTIAKYWVGVGALRRHEHSYRTAVLSPQQAASIRSSWEDVSIPGLKGKNFGAIRIVN